MTGPSIRRCHECGAPQRQTRGTIDYGISGLDNVVLENVPIAVCPDGHDEFCVPAADRLDTLLAERVLRKPALLSGKEIRFLRSLLECYSKEFAQKIGITPVQLSRMEKGHRPVTRRTDRMIRLVVAASMSAENNQPFPKDLVHLLDELEESGETLSLHFKHVENVPLDRQWIEVAPEPAAR